MRVLVHLKGMIDDPISVEQFCRRYVEPMGEESDHVHIVAITDALQVFSLALMGAPFTFIIP